MNIDLPGIYHIYNRGINKQRIFYNRANYLYFLRKCHKYLKPVTDIFAWSLAPTHFDFLLEVNEKSLVQVKQGCLLIPAVSNAFRILQSTYAKGLNIHVKRTGNLFQQKAKSVFIDDQTHVISTFHYIHQIPIIDGLVKSVVEWPYTSYQDYIGIRAGSLCNQARALQLLNLETENIVNCLQLQFEQPT